MFRFVQHSPLVATIAHVPNPKPPFVKPAHTPIVGDTVGLVDGDTLGADVAGDNVGAGVGDVVVGDMVGAVVGDTVGDVDGVEVVGETDGDTLGKEAV